MICMKCGCRFTTKKDCEVVCQSCREEYIQTLPSKELPGRTKNKYKAWPYNLYMVVLGYPHLNELPSDAAETIAYLLSFMTKNEQAVINYRFNDCLTFRKIGKILSLSPARISQICAKAIRKLTNKPSINYLKNGLTVERRVEAFEKEHIRIYNLIPLDQIHFSARACNALKRVNINTLNDISRTTRDQLLSIRNIGKATLEEIIDKCREFGIEIQE